MPAPSKALRRLAGRSESLKPPTKPGMEFVPDISPEPGATPGSRAVPLQTHPKDWRMPLLSDRRRT